VALKQDLEPRAGDPEYLAAAAAAAGYLSVRASTAEVATGLSTPAQLAAWRLGMAHAAPFLSGLGEPARAAVRQEAERAVARTRAGPLVVSMLVLTAQ
jgi:hypothetical protein